MFKLCAHTHNRGKISSKDVHGKYISGFPTNLEIREDLERKSVSVGNIREFEKNA